MSGVNKMSAFGWSYPPGCSGPPEYDDQPCEICGLFPDDCICPECPTCSAFGDPKCYENHGLERSQEQVQSLARQQDEWCEQIERENAYADEMIKAEAEAEAYWKECEEIKRGEERINE